MKLLLDYFFSRVTGISPVFLFLLSCSLMDQKLFVKRFPGLLLGLLCGLFIFNYLAHEHYQKLPPIIRDLVWNDINFIHTTDTHGWYSGHANQPQYHANWGHFVSFVAHLRDIADANHQDLLVVDTGDRHDGNGFSDVTTPNGKESLPIFVQQDYDLVTIGNHELYEFENSRQEYELVVPHYGDKYVCSNVEYILANGTHVPFGSKYRYFQTKNQKLNVLALAFLFDFNRFNAGTKVTPIREAVEQEWFKKVLHEHTKDTVDVVVVFGHIPVTHKWAELGDLHKILRKAYPNTRIQYFGGHSHIRDFSVYDEKLTGLQSGRFCETVGWVSFNTSEPQKPADTPVSAGDAPQSVLQPKTGSLARSYIDFNLNSFQHHARYPASFDTPEGAAISKDIHRIRRKLNLGEVIGHVTQSNYYMDYVPLEHPKNLFKLLTDRVLPTLNHTNPNFTSPTPGARNRIILINTGSVRYDLYKGKYTIDTEYIVSPFRNNWVRVMLPREYAVKIADTLNGWSYILALERDLNPYAPASGASVHESDPAVNLLAEGSAKSALTKGYVTHDDLGSDGDDTPHRAVVNFPIPNVVQSVELGAEDELVEVVFYEFILSNVVWALKELDFTEKNVEAEFYSDVYLGKLLNHYVQNYGV